MAEQITLAARTRDGFGTGEARRLRRAGWLPAVVSDEKAQSASIMVNTHEFEVLMERHADRNLILDLDIEGVATRKVLLREVQHHPVSSSLLHVDFAEVSLTKRLRVGVRIELMGEPVGVSEQGGLLEQNLRELEVECLASDLVERIHVDVSGLGIGDNVQVRDLSVGSKLTVLTPEDVAVVSVVMPREEEEEAPPEAEEGEEAPAEGEEKPEGEEAEAGEQDQQAQT